MKKIISDLLFSRVFWIIVQSILLLFALFLVGNNVSYIPESTSIHEKFVLTLLNIYNLYLTSYLLRCLYVDIYLQITGYGGIKEK